MATLQSTWEINHYYSLDEFQNDARLTGFVWHRHYRARGAERFYKNHASASRAVRDFAEKRFVRSGAGYWHFAIVSVGAGIEADDAGVIAYRRFVRYIPD